MLSSQSVIAVTALALGNLKRGGPGLHGSILEYSKTRILGSVVRKWYKTV